MIERSSFLREKLTEAIKIVTWPGQNTIPTRLTLTATLLFTATGIAYLSFINRGEFNTDESLKPGIATLQTPTITSTPEKNISDCIQIGPNQWAQLICVDTPNYRGCHQISCAAPPVTPVPLSGLESNAPEDEDSRLFEKVAGNHASEQEIIKFNNQALEGMTVQTWITKNGEEKRVPQVDGLTPVQFVLSDSKTKERKLTVGYINSTGKLMVYLDADGSLIQQATSENP